MKKIYLITEESLSHEELIGKTEEALNGGIEFLQYRVKHKSDHMKEIEAKVLKNMCHRFGTKFLINDDVSLALRVGADGVHLGVGDVKVASVRKKVSSEFIIGATAKTVSQAKLAEKAGANYLGVGAIYASKTKIGAKRITSQMLADIKVAVQIPLYGIGGLDVHNITPSIVNSTDGLCFISGIYQSRKIIETVNAIKSKLR